MLGDEHPTPVKHVAAQGSFVANNLALVPWRKVLCSTQIVRAAIKVNADDGRNLCPDQVGLVWPGYERSAAIDEVEAAPCMDPCMSRRSCSTTTTSHAQHGTSIRWAPSQASYAHHASPVGASGVNAKVIDAEGVHRTQALGPVGATPCTEVVLERRGQTEPTAGRPREPGRVSGGGLWRLAKPRLNKPTHAFHFVRFNPGGEGLDGGVNIDGFDAKSIGCLQGEAFDTGLFEAGGHGKQEQRRTRGSDGIAGHRMHQRSHVPPSHLACLRLWATRIGKSFKLDERESRP